MEVLQQNVEKVLDESITQFLKDVDEYCAQAKEDAEREKEVVLEQIEAEKAKWNEYVSHIPQLAKAQKVKLDVGGVKFYTTLTTLTSVPNSKLAQMFTGDSPLRPDAEGYYFIDRDGTSFRPLLNFLRNPKEFDASSVKDLAQLEAEAKYFGLFEALYPDFANAERPAQGPIPFTILDASSEYSGCPKSNLLTDDVNSYWLSASGSTTNQWISFDFGKCIAWSSLRIRLAAYECSLKDFAVQTSNSPTKTESGWKTIAKYTAECGLKNSGWQQFAVKGIGRYVRIYMYDNHGPGGGSYILVSQVQFFP